MRYPCFGALIIAAGIALAPAVVLLPSASSAEELRDLLPFGRTHRIARMLPTVVNITAHKMVQDPPGPSADPEPHVTEIAGSGFIVDSSGLIVTNRHVVDGSLDLTVILQDGTALPAKVVGTGGAVDIALLEVSPTKLLPKVTWGDSDSVRIGDQVLAVGNPLGIGESVTEGIVSATNRDITTSPFDDYIQTDAAINHGNSGGPLFNMKGRVIGVNTALYTPAENGGSVGLGFAIPGNDAQYVVDQLRRFHRLQRGWLGVRMQDVTPNIADALGLHAPTGAIIVEVEDGGPASGGKLQVGDVVLKFGKQAPKDARALARMVALSQAGDTDPVVVWRDGKQQIVPITIAEWPDEPKAAPAKPGNQPGIVPTDAPNLGLQVAAISSETRAKYKLADAQTGVVVTGTVRGSTAEERGLRPGDVILRVQQTPVSTEAELHQQLDGVRDQKRHHVLVLVQGHGGLRWVPLEISPVQ